MESKNDLDRYKAMLEVYETQDEANEAIGKFYDLVEAARSECKITDIHLVVKLTTKDGVMLSMMHLGDSREGEAMCAWALGKETKGREQAIAQLLKGR